MQTLAHMIGRHGVRAVLRRRHHGKRIAKSECVDAHSSSKAKYGGENQYAVYAHRWGSGFAECSVRFSVSASSSASNIARSRFIE